MNGQREEDIDSNLSLLTELLHLDDVAVIENMDAFECPVCEDIILPGQGIMLRECLHFLCKECLQNLVKYSGEPVVRCPYSDAICKQCFGIIQEREIKALVTENIYKKFMAKCDRSTLAIELDTTPAPITSNSSLMADFLHLDDVGVIKNKDVFRCPVCVKEIQPGQGFILRDCFHFLCNVCLTHLVDSTEEALVRCPYLHDTNQQCVGIIQEREIKGIVAKNIYEKFLEKCNRIAYAVATTGAFAASTLFADAVHLDDEAVIKNNNAFECLVCADDIQQEQGVTLRDCLHSLCAACLSRLVDTSDEALVRCPFLDDKNQRCVGVIEEREIKAIVAKNIYDKFLQKSIRIAEGIMKDSFHCITPNCTGWCILGPLSRTFNCPVCKIINCVKCRAVHTNLTCHRYELRQRDKVNSDTTAKMFNAQLKKREIMYCPTCQAVHTNLTCHKYQLRQRDKVNNDATVKILNAQLKKREIMYCPTCQALVEKTAGGGGCDLIRCAVCKTEICWATRGPRWGPKGKGDTSGGCRCKINGIRCTPKCEGCH